MFSYFFLMFLNASSANAGCREWLTKAAGTVNRAVASVRNRVAPPNWQPSDSLIGRAKFAGREDLLKGSFDSPIDVEVQVPQNQHLVDTWNSLDLDQADKDLQRAWFSGQPNLNTFADAKYPTAAYYVAAIYRSELAMLRAHDLTVHWPRHGSVLYGTFRVTGTLGDLSSYFARVYGALIDRPMPTSATARPAMISIWIDRPVTIDDVRTLLHGTEFRLDESKGVVSLDPRMQTYVAFGHGSEASFAEVNAIKGLSVHAEPKLLP